MTDDIDSQEHTTVPAAAAETDPGTASRAAFNLNMEYVKTGLIAAIALVVGVMVGIVMGGDGAIVADLEAEVSSLEAQLADADNDLSDVSRQAAALVQDVEDLEGIVTELQAVVPMPDYSGDMVSSARSDATGHGWSVSERSEPSAQPEGTVISQEPAAGTEMELGTAVVLVVAEPMPAEWYEVWSQSGTGRVKTPVIDLPDVEMGDLRVTYDFRGTGHNALWLCNMVGENEDLLHNDIGSISNTSTLYLSWDGLVFDIDGGGSWTVTLEAFGVPSS